MPTIKMTARKMREADVQFISLVERGANRIPFKVIKQESQMSKAFTGLDLGRMFSRKAEPEPVAIVGIVTMKGEGFESVKKQVEEAGFKVDDVEEMDDGSVVFKQEEFEGEGTVIRMNDHVVMITKGFSPYNMEMDIEGGEVSFSDAVSARGFYPGLSSIMGTLSERIESTVRKSSSPSEASKAVSKMFDEARAYTSSFLNALPAKAFKLETIEPEVISKEEGDEAVAAVAAAADTIHPAVEEEVTDEGGSTDAETTAEVAKSDAEGSEAEKVLTAEEVADIVKTTVGSTDESVKKLGDALVANFATVTKSLEALQASFAAMSTRVDAAESVAKAAKDAVTGTVITGSDADDRNPNGNRVREYKGGEIDTAFLPRNKRTNQSADRH